MPPPYNPIHWREFTASPYKVQGPVGESPAVWAEKYGLAGIPNAHALPRHILDRTAVQQICRDPTTNVLFGYVCAMAWGGQGTELGGPSHVASAWAANAIVASHLTALRSGGITRCQAYNLFLGGAGKVQGLGPSFFTKLLYFFSPTDDFYIMDQWTGKAVDLLTGCSVVRIAGNAPAGWNKCGNYQAYCEEVDQIATLLSVAGIVAEEMLFSKGNPNPWRWRVHVRANWPARGIAGRYSRNLMHTNYPHIPAAFF